MLVRASLIVFLLGCNVAYAALFGDSRTQEQFDALQNKVQEMEARMQRTEEVLMGQALIELHTQTQTLRDELGKLRGLIEVLQEENRSLRKQQKDFYLDLDNRLRQLEPDSPAVTSRSSHTLEPSSAVSERLTTPVDPVVSRSAAVLQLPDAEQRNRYDAAFSAFKSGNYSSAITGFENFLSQYPRSALAPAAAYWIGNAYYALRDFDKAIAAQKQLIDSYPDSTKAADGLLNMASSQVEIGQKAVARKTLNKIIADYPGSEAAEKAERRLNSLK